MSDLNILIVEGNIREDSEFFIKAAGASAADNLKNLILKIEPSAITEIINPGHDDETTNALKNMSKYNGIVFTGGAMRINDMTDVIKKHINFASNCFNQKKKILAICWGLQVCSVAAGGKVNPGKKGAHIGIASDVIINNEGEKHFIYKDKKKIFTSPAFNFDEVSELPKNTTLLSSDKVNNVMGVSFNAESSEIIGLQYHPDYEYLQMLNLIDGRKERLFINKNFLNEEEYQSHIAYIKSENELLNFSDRTCEVRNWLNYISN
jgi:GMP synthase (glutamine-hydrolysing)